MTTKLSRHCIAMWLAVLPAAFPAFGAEKHPAPAPNPAAPAPEPVDPAVWKEPHEMPPVVSDMPDEAYHRALAEAVKKVDMNAMQRPDDPLPEAKTVVDLDAPWKPQTAYWHSSKRDPKWDQQMFVACSEFDSDPRLAQAALADAAHAGYKDWLLPALEARIAFNQWRFDDTLAFGSFALADAPADRKPVIARWMYSAAKADYKLEEALRLSAAYAVTDKDELDRLHEAFRAYQALNTHPRIEPIVALSKLSLKDVHENISVIHVKGSVKSPQQTNEFKKSGKLVMEAPPGRMQLFAFGPKAADVDFTAHFRFHAQGGKAGRNNRSLGFGLIDPKDNGEEQCDVSLFSGALLEVEASGPMIGIEEFPPGKWQKDGTIRMIALGPDLEVFIDGKRAYFGPIRAPAATRQLGFLVSTSGVRAEITDVTWKKIEGNPEKEN